MSSIQKRLRFFTKLAEKHWSDWYVDDRGKHHKLILRHGKHRRTHPIPLTASDCRALKNWERELKHKVQELKGLKP